MFFTRGGLEYHTLSNRSLQSKEMIDCTNDVDLQLKMISNEGNIHVWYSWSTGSYLGIIVDLYTK